MTQVQGSEILPLLSFCFPLITYLLAPVHFRTFHICQGLPIIREQSPITFCIKVWHPEFSIICIGSESCLWSIVGLPGSYACYPTFRSIG